MDIIMYPYNIHIMSLFQPKNSSSFGRDRFSCRARGAKALTTSCKGSTLGLWMPPRWTRMQLPDADSWPAAGRWNERCSRCSRPNWETPTCPEKCTTFLCMTSEPRRSVSYRNTRKTLLPAGKSIICIYCANRYRQIRVHAPQADGTTHQIPWPHPTEHLRVCGGDSNHSSCARHPGFWQPLGGQHQILLLGFVALIRRALWAISFFTAWWLLLLPCFNCFYDFFALLAHILRFRKIYAYNRDKILYPYYRFCPVL